MKLDWTPAEKEVLLRPSIEFNPPVRFLQSTGHKQLVGLELDKVNLATKFVANDAAPKFKHLVKRTVIDEKGPSATASYSEVFDNFVGTAKAQDDGAGSALGGAAQSGGSGGPATQASSSTSAANTVSGPPDGGLKPNALFSYPVTCNDQTLSQLMKEAKGLNTKQFPAAGSALLRSIIEVILKLITEANDLNKQGKLLDIEGALNLVVGSGKMNPDDVKVLKEFKGSHLSYINLSAHATLVPNHLRLMMVRDCVDAFVKRNV